MIERRLALAAPIAGSGATSAARILDDWYVACFSSELGRTPLARVVCGVPLVVFRTAAGRVAAFLDRCPHRNVPLSIGSVQGETLECGYHGWRFETDGQCSFVPGLCSDADPAARAVDAFPCEERDGLVWVYPTAGATPERAPFAIPHLGEPGWAVVYDQFETVGTLHAVAENALDVPHTAFLHKGLFRGTGDANTLEVIVRRWHDRVEAEYVGEPAPRGLVGRILAPGGGVTTHFDRFILPCVAQVEYRLSERAHVVVNSALTPIDDFSTRLFAVVCFKLPFPDLLVKLILKPIARRIFAQDARILALQDERVQAFGGEHFVSTELDVLGQHIRGLLRSAERGKRAPVETPKERRIQMRV